ncbi:MAG: hypothetical protein HKN21_11120 [Candidatus Eisenbacteria bacterium]|uniref:Uncharacterized protein n=1 Tax=Eiseniibacteriota bacterium TaxID=2212470 RepID=A0A7Y2E8U5_UNCEI|nr:hypothetical protein [Candidatus Eisenbacteria bacterium]
MAKTKKKQPKGGDQSSSPEIVGGASWPPLAWVAALIVVAMLVGVSQLPPYKPRLGTSYHQVRLFPTRLQMSQDELHLNFKRKDYPAVRRIRDSTFSDATILISNQAADKPLNSVLWLSYYLYPRVLVTNANLEIDPSIPLDFMIMTPNFHPGIPDSLATSRFVAPVSDRAKAYVEENW